MIATEALRILLCRRPTYCKIKCISSNERARETRKERDDLTTSNIMELNYYYASNFNVISRRALSHIDQ